MWHRKTSLSRERIIERFWSECEPERGRSSLNTALWSIRRCLRDGGIDADAALSANKTQVVWLADGQLDICDFEELAKSTEITHLREAVALFRGDFLDGDYSEWSVAQRERVGAILERLLGELVAREGDVEAARRLIDLGSFDETPYATVIRAELQSGNHTGALNVAQRFRLAMHEVGASPSQAFEDQVAGLLPSERASNLVVLPFCGRTGELKTLEAAFLAATQGHGGVIILHGNAGEGKSELLAQAELAASHVALRVVKIAARADDARAFGPWALLYEQVTGTSFPAFLQAGGDAQRLSDAFAELLSENTVLLVDDAQFLTGDACAVLLHLGNARSTSNLLLIIATRPENSRNLLSAMPQASNLELGYLPLEDIAHVLASVATQGAHHLAEFLFERSGGHAFFLTKLFESLVSSGLVRQHGNAWVISESITTDAETPKSIRDFIVSRLHARGEDATTIACALALEPDASSSDLSVATQLSEARTLDAIDDLIGLGFLDQPERGPEFRFRHDLIRETAFRALNSGRRVQMHRAFAQHFESDERRESMVRRAQHLRASGQVLAAAKAFAKAAYAVLEVNARNDALEWALAGIDVVKNLKPSVRMHSVLAELYEVATRASEETNNRKEALVYSNHRLDHARHAEDPALVCRALTRRAVIYLELAPPEQAFGDAREAIQIAEELGDAKLLIFAYIRQSLCQQFLGQGEEATQSARRAVEMARRLGEPQVLASAMERLLAVLCIWNNLDEAQDLAHEGLEFARRADLRTEATFRTRRSCLFYLLDRIDAATDELSIVAELIESATTSGKLFRLHGQSVSLLLFAHDAQVATLALAQGSWDDLLSAANRLRANHVANGYSRRGIADLYLIEGLLGRNAPGDAEQAWTLAQSLPSHPVAKGIVGMGLLRESVLARSALRLQRHDAHALLHHAVDALVAQVLVTPMDGGREFRVLAQAATEAGLASLAADLYARSANLQRSKNLSLASPPEIHAIAG